MPRAKKSKAEKLAERDAISRVESHSSEIMSHCTRFKTIIRSRMLDSVSSQEIKEVNSSEIFGITDGIERICAQILISPSNLFGSEDFDLELQSWIERLNTYSQMISEQPPASKSSSVMKRFISRAALNHFGKIRAKVPDLISNLSQLKYNETSELQQDSLIKQEIPEQILSPIMTSVVDSVLVVKETDPKLTSKNINELKIYLSEQLTLIVSDLQQSNVDQRSVALFTEGVNILEDWSASKILAFGAHTQTLARLKTNLDAEVSVTTSLRMEGLILNSEYFLNMFDEWSNFVNQSMLQITNTPDIIDLTKNDINQIASELIKEDEAVEKKIPQALQQYTGLLSNNVMKIRSIGIGSALRTVRNSAISLALHVREMASSAGRLIQNSKAMKLAKVFCRIFSRLKALGTVDPGMRFIGGLTELTEFCAVITALVPS